MVAQASPGVGAAQVPGIRGDALGSGYSPPPMSVVATIFEVLSRSFLEPIKALRARYVPLLMIYFAYGAGQIIAIEQQFFERERLTISAEALAELGVWLTVPWTIKMVFGQLVDAVAIFGSRRRVYVFIGATLMSAGYGCLIASAGGTAKATALYIAGQLLVVVGFVLQDVVADTMSTEVVERTGSDGAPRAEADVEADLGTVQVLGRLSLMTGVLVASAIGGVLAERFDSATVFAIGLVVPAISVLGAILVRVDATEAGRVDPRILGGGVVFGIFSVAMGMSEVPFGAEIVFGVSLATVLTLLWFTVRDLDPAKIRSIAIAAFVIFVYRATPNVGPGVTWWQIDDLHFDEVFFGKLATLGSFLTIAGIWFGTRAVTHRPIGHVLGALTIVGFVLFLPYIGMKYGLHDWTSAHLGFGARTIAIFDTSLSAPFGQLAMIPMLTLVAIHAPPARRATWFALMASLMNLALSAAGLSTKYLNQVFHVSRGHYDELGPLMITVNLIGLVVPLAVIAFAGKSLASAITTQPKAPSGEAP